MIPCLEGQSTASSPLQAISTRQDIPPGNHPGGNLCQQIYHSLKRKKENIYIYKVVGSVCLSVCLLTRTSKTTCPIELKFGGRTRSASGKVLGPIFFP